MTTTKDLIKESIEKITKIKPNLSKEDIHKTEELMVKMMEKGMLPKDAMGLDDAFLEHLYKNANTFFKSGKYDNAIGIYRLLMIFNPLDERFPMALGASYHQQKKYLEALNFYALSSSLDPNNALTYYHASDCLIKCNNEEAALMMLKTALKKVPSKNSILKERIQNSIKTIEEKLK